MFDVKPVSPVSTVGRVGLVQVLPFLLAVYTPGLDECVADAAARLGYLFVGPLQPQFAQSRMIVGAAAQRPMEFPFGFGDR